MMDRIGPPTKARPPEFPSTLPRPGLTDLNMLLVHCQRRLACCTVVVGVVLLCACCVTSRAHGNDAIHAGRRISGRSLLQDLPSFPAAPSKQGQPVPGQFIVMLKRGHGKPRDVADDISRRGGVDMQSVRPFDALEGFAVRCAGLLGPGGDADTSVVVCGQ